MSLPKLFVDTSAWVAINDVQDSYHYKALVFNQVIARKYKIVVTDYVLDETYTLLLYNAGYSSAIHFHKVFNLMVQESIAEVIWVNSTIADRAWQIFEQFNRDKAWSFTDCTSYVVMKEQSITEVFTFDRHFSQMGFIRLPNSL